MTIFGQHIPHENISNLAVALGGLLGGTVPTVMAVMKAIHPYYAGILFVWGMISYSLGIYATIKHIRNIKKKGQSE